MPWRTLQIVSAVGGIALTVILSFFLPDRVATHFNISGRPDSWSSNLMNTIFFSATFILFNLLFLGIVQLLKKIPVSLINMPNREYWFAPERRPATVVKIGGFMAEFNFFTNLFIAGLLLLTFYANRTAQPLPLIPMIALLALFLLFVVGWIIHLYRAFKLPK